MASAAQAGRSVSAVEGEVGSAMRRTGEIRVDLNALIRRANLLLSGIRLARYSYKTKQSRE